MQIVIDISEEEYAWVKRASRQTTPLDRFCVKAIANGTPLPEHHGRLIDEKDLSLLTVHMIDGMFICDAPTIIEGSDSECRE